MAIPVWATNDVPTASDFNNWFTPRGKIKASATSISSDATLNNDPELTGLAVEANARFRYEFFVEVESPATADIRILITGPAGFAYRGSLWNGAANASVNMDDGTSVFAGTTGGTGGNNDRMYAIGWLTTAGTAGSLTLQWAQQTSDAGTTTLKPGSWLQITRLS